MASTCSGCQNSWKNTPGISFFRFPRDPERCKKWVTATGRVDLLQRTPESLYTSNVLCAEHFKDSQFANLQEKKRLTKTAVPTIFPKHVASVSRLPGRSGQVGNETEKSDEQCEHQAYTSSWKDGDDDIKSEEDYAEYETLVYTDTAEDFHGTSHLTELNNQRMDSVHIKQEILDVDDQRNKVDGIRRETPEAEVIMQLESATGVNGSFLSAESHVPSSDNNEHLEEVTDPQYHQSSSMRVKEEYNVEEDDAKSENASMTDTIKTEEDGEMTETRIAKDPSFSPESHVTSSNGSRHVEVVSDPRSGLVSMVVQEGVWDDDQKREDASMAKAVRVEGDDEVVANQHERRDPEDLLNFQEQRNPVRKAVSSIGKIVLGNHQYCYFCGKLQLDLGEHLCSLHKDKPETAKLVKSKASNVEEYLRQLKRLKCMGNFVHNIESLRSNIIDTVVVETPTIDRQFTDYLPCLHCYGFYVIEELWDHVQDCDLRKLDEEGPSSTNDSTETSSTNVIQQSRLLLESSSLTGDEPALSVSMRILIQATRKDELTWVFSKDNLLILFGATLMKNYGLSKKNDIVHRVRQLARLLLTCQAKTKTDISYRDLLCGEKIDTCLNGIFSLCDLYKTADGRHHFETPSLALRLGQLLRNMTVIKQGCCLSTDDSTGMRDADTFRKLLKAKWADAVVRYAHNTKQTRKELAVQFLLVADDLRLLRHFQITQMRKFINEMKTRPSYVTWCLLAKHTMTRMTVFNKISGGEVSRLLVETYSERPALGDQTNEEVMSCLQPLEKELMKRMDLVHMPAKKNRKVPALIASDVKEGITTLLETRDAVGISVTNPYCFAKKFSDDHFDSWDAMNTVIQDARVKHPELISSNRLRRYHATVSQLFDLNQVELAWLTNHIGSELNIYKDFYRLSESPVEIIKVACLLMAFDSGNAPQFLGKQWKLITLADFGYEDFTQEGEDSEDEIDKQDESGTQEEESLYKGNEPGSLLDTSLAVQSDKVETSSTSASCRPEPSHDEVTSGENLPRPRKRAKRRKNICDNSADSNSSDLHPQHHRIRTKSRRN